MTDHLQPHRSWLLAIDTSTEQASVGLTDGQQVDELSWHAGRDQTLSVLSGIDHLMQRRGLGAAAIRAVAVATGPGMFNGLRVGLSIAKGFTLGVDAALIGISTLEATVWPWSAHPGTLVGVVAAGRGRVVWQQFAGGADFRALGEPTNGTVEELAALAATLPPDSVVTGDLLPDQAALLGGMPTLVVPPVAGRTRHAAALLDIGWQRYRAGMVDDPGPLEPTYVHSVRAEAGATA